MLDATSSFKTAEGSKHQSKMASLLTRFIDSEHEFDNEVRIGFRGAHVCMNNHPPPLSLRLDSTRLDSTRLDSQALNMLIWQLRMSSCAVRRDFYLAVRKCRRRTTRAWEETPLRKLFSVESADEVAMSTCTPTRLHRQTRKAPGHIIYICAITRTQLIHAFTR